MEDFYWMKAQSAIELLTTYSWALLIIGFVLAMAFILIFSNNQNNYLSFSCNIQPQMPCIDAELVTYNATRPIGYRIAIINQLQNPMVLGANAFNVITTGIGQQASLYTYGNCYPSTLLAGAEALCNVSISGNLEPPVGTAVPVTFTLTYGLCSINSISSCSSNTAYISSGQSLQPISTNPVIGLHNIKLSVNLWINNGSVPVGAGNLLVNRNSSIIIDGLPYDTGNIILISGHYSMFGRIGDASNSVFGLWNTINQGSPNLPTVIANPYAINTTINVQANATINATFTTARCSPFENKLGPSGGGATWGASLVCPYTCPYVNKAGPNGYYCLTT